MNKKIVKLQWGNSFNWSTGNASYNPQAAFGATNFKPNPNLLNLSNGFAQGSTLGVPNVSNLGKHILNNPKVAGNSTSPSMGQQALSGAVSQIGGALANNIGNTLFDQDTHFGSIMGGLFSSASSSALGNLSSNILKGNALTQGMGKDMLGSVGGAAAGIAANYAGRGITKAMGNSNLGKFTGAAAANVGGTLAGSAISSAVGATSASKFIGMANAAVNPLALGMTAVGAGLGAMNGPSKEYGGKYGDITKTMDTIYDIASVGVNAIPGIGQIISGAMVLNKGLSNTFGSTSGMTKQDAILGSAFMPAPVKWANVAGGKTTSTFNKQSWQNSEKTSNFMQNAFGDLQDRFDRARKEAGKTYGTFSRRAYRRAQANLNFANQAWDKVLSMADQNIYQNIRAQDMASINNQKYMQDIQGGFSPLARGKQGMKILSNRINHNTGMRLLSGAALIDNKQMILCNGVN